MLHASRILVGILDAYYWTEGTAATLRVADQGWFKRGQVDIMVAIREAKTVTKRTANRISDRIFVLCKYKSRVYIYSNAM